MRRTSKHTQTRSCVITTSACWQAACRAELGTRSPRSALEVRARLRGALMSSLVQWAKRSSSLGRLCSITASRRRPDNVMSGPSPGVGGGKGATNSFCSYLALIHDSRSSLKRKEDKMVDIQWNTVRASFRCITSKQPVTSHLSSSDGLSLPCGIRRRFAAAQRAALPYTVHHVVANGAENQRQLAWQIVEVERANARQVGPQVSVDPWTLNAYESAQVQTGPSRILERRQKNQAFWK